MIESYFNLFVTRFFGYASLSITLALSDFAVSQELDLHAIGLPEVTTSELATESDPLNQQIDTPESQLKKLPDAENNPIKRHVSLNTTNWFPGSAREPQELQAPPAVAPEHSVTREAELPSQCVPRQEPGNECFPGGDEREVSTKTPNPLDRFNEKWNVKFGGHVQMDYVNWANASPAIVSAQDYFEFRRLRLVADGTGYGVYDFRLQMTFEPETVGETQPLGTVASPDVKDAYLSMNEIPGLGRFRIGNFFVPFSLEQVTNDTNNVFMERSIPSQGVFSAEREVGIALYNSTDDQTITWTSGIFLDSISEGLKERIDDNQGYRVSGRLTCLPFYDETTNGRYLWHTGLGVLHTEDNDNRVRIRARPQIHEGPRLIDSGVMNASSYTTGNIESALVFGRLTLQSEAFLSNVRLLDSDSRQVQGCYVHGSYFLTGENRIFEKFGQHGPQFGRNVPKSNFFVTDGHSSRGAWELKSRWSYLDLNNVGAGQYNDFTAGVNWYWSDRTRIMLDWIHPFTSTDSVFGRTEADLLAMRFDFNW